LTSPCGKIRIPINESQDDKSQIEEYLREYRGEGIQHIALATDDIYRTVDVLRGPRRRVPGYPRDLLRGHRRARLRPSRECRGAAQSPHPHRRQWRDREGVLLQIFTANVIGPIFFEIIQRKGNQVSARAISRPCSSPLNSTRFAEVSFESRALQLLAQLGVLPCAHRAQPQVIAIRLPRRRPDARGRRSVAARYRSINPQARVPTLVHDGPRFHAIAGYHSSTSTRCITSRRCCRGPGSTRTCAHAFAGHRLRHSALAEHQHDEIPAETLKLDDAAASTWLREWITRGLDAFNAHLEHDHLSGKFCHGDTPTMADCCLVPQMFAAERFGVDPTHYPRLALIWENCTRMSAFAAAHPSRQPDAADRRAPRCLRTQSPHSRD
jgi:glutathione S-transferase